MSMPKPKPMMEVAQDLAERGFHVIPLNGKKSFIKWEEFQRRAPTDEEIAGWWATWPNANVGIITGIIHVVLDSDTPQAQEFLLSGKVTRTPWRVKTPRGWHHYYRINPGLTLTNSAGNGLDTRGLGGYVVAAGSAGYSWEVDIAYGATDVGDLPMLTGADISSVNGFRANMAQPTNAIGDPQGEVFANLGAISLPHDGAPVPQGGRNNALASLVGQWISQGMVLSDILAHARIWNQTNTPPLADAEIIQTVTSIVIGHQKRHGEAVPLSPAGPQGELVVMPYGDLLDNPPPEPETFWGRGVFFRGARLLIGGAPKVGKSRFYLALAVAAATGSEFLGIRFEKPLRVMWVQAEIHLSFVRERINSLAVGLSEDDHDLLADNLIVTGRLDLDLTSPRDLASIDAAIEKYSPDVVCFDPVINFSTADENKNTEVRALLRAVDSLGAKYNTANVLVHHTRKDAVNSGSGGGAGASFESVRGASAFRGWYDTGILLGGDSANTTVAFECRNAKAHDNLVASFNEPTGTYQVSDLMQEASQGQQAKPMATKAQVAVGDRVSLILGLLGQFPEGLMSGDFKNRIDKAFNISPRTTDRMLRSMATGGLVVVERHGANLALYKVANQ